MITHVLDTKHVTGNKVIAKDATVTKAQFLMTLIAWCENQTQIQSSCNRVIRVRNLGNIVNTRGRYVSL